MLCPAPVPSRDPPRSLTTTLAPSLARVSAYSRPKPPPAPVTTTTRSCTPGMKFLSRVRAYQSFSVYGGEIGRDEPGRQSAHPIAAIRRSIAAKGHGGEITAAELRLKPSGKQ